MSLTTKQKAALRKAQQASARARRAAGKAIVDLAYKLPYIKQFKSQTKATQRARQALGAGVPQAQKAYSDPKTMKTFEPSYKRALRAGTRGRIGNSSPKTVKDLSSFYKRVVSKSRKNSVPSRVKRASKNIEWRY